MTLSQNLLFLLISTLYNNGLYTHPQRHHHQQHNPQTEQKEAMKPSPKSTTMNYHKLLPDPSCRHLLIILPPLLLLVLVSLSALSTTTTTTYNLTPFFSLPKPPIGPVHHLKQEPELRDRLNRSRIAVCLVGGARRFELTGPSIVENILRLYPNSDVYLHSPLDKDSFKFLLLKKVPGRLVTVRIFTPSPMPETEAQVRVLTAANSPNGIQGLLQYFNLVEGCLTMMKTYQTQHNFTYDWIIRTRVDGYWSAPLDPENFIPGRYLIPPGSNFGGLNDRLGIGDINTSTIALSRLSLIPELDSFGYTRLNSETAFKAQLATQGIKFLANRLPFCIVSDRKYPFPSTPFGVPVASMSSPGPMSGVKCRPCRPVCVGSCVGDVMRNLNKGHGWTNWEHGTLELCDAHDEWEVGWEKLFDQAAGKKFADVRRRIKALSLTDCINDFEEMRIRTANWDSPNVTEICRLGLLPQ